MAEDMRQLAERLSEVSLTTAGEQEQEGDQEQDVEQSSNVDSQQDTDSQPGPTSDNLAAGHLRAVSYDLAASERPDQTHLDILLGCHADILCLQSVSGYDSFWREALGEHGYASCYASAPEAPSSPGVAIFWANKRWDAKSQPHVVEFDSLSSATLKPVPLYNTDNVGIYVNLQSVPSGTAKGSTRLIVGNVDFHRGEDAPAEIAFNQAQLMLESMHAGTSSSGGDKPVVLAGAFPPLKENPLNTLLSNITPWCASGPMSRVYEDVDSSTQLWITQHFERVSQLPKSIATASYDGPLLAEMFVNIERSKELRASLRDRQAERRDSTAGLSMLASMHPARMEKAMHRRSDRGQSNVCRYWLRGRCTYGQACKFVHEGTPDVVDSRRGSPPQRMSPPFRRAARSSPTMAMMGTSPPRTFDMRPEYAEYAHPQYSAYPGDAYPQGRGYPPAVYPPPVYSPLYGYAMVMPSGPSAWGGAVPVRRPGPSVHEAMVGRDMQQMSPIYQDQARLAVTAADLQAFDGYAPHQTTYADPYYTRPMDSGMWQVHPAQHGDPIGGEMSPRDYRGTGRDTA